MTDRELLELAAKAAGIDAEWHNDDDADFDAAHEGMFLKGERGPDNSKYWNPLMCDGDALRLAVKLGFEIVQFPKHVRVCANDGEDFHVNHQDDPCAATRRAIVRAAAEIGRTMP
jgi:hypothetical protein